MSRVKRGTISIKRRRNVLKQVKGYRFGRSKKERAAREAIVHAGAYAFAHRRDKKADRRANWQVKMNAEARKNGLSYSKLINLLKKGKVGLDRKILAQIAENHPEIFKKILEQVIK